MTAAAGPSALRRLLHLAEELEAPATTHVGVCRGLPRACSAGPPSAVVRPLRPRLSSGCSAELLLLPPPQRARAQTPPGAEPWGGPQLLLLGVSMRSRSPATTETEHLPPREIGAAEPARRRVLQPLAPGCPRPCRRVERRGVQRVWTRRVAANSSSRTTPRPPRNAPAPPEPARRVKRRRSTG